MAHQLICHFEVLERIDGIFQNVDIGDGISSSKEDFSGEIRVHGAARYTVDSLVTPIFDKTHSPFSPTHDENFERRKFEFVEIEEVIIQQLQRGRGIVRRVLVAVVVVIVVVAIFKIGFGSICFDGSKDTYTNEFDLFQAGKFLPLVSSVNHIRSELITANDGELLKSDQVTKTRELTKVTIAVLDTESAK